MRDDGPLILSAVLDAPVQQRLDALRVTVSNKVAPAAARALHAELAASFVPERTRAVALALWRYRGGPWEPVARFAFSGQEPGREETGPTNSCGR